MSTETYFIGDVHGRADMLARMISLIESRGAAAVVLLGDYINKGPSGAQVVQYLIDYRGPLQMFPLLGNHEEALLTVLDSRDVRPFLRMSGAPTIRSYVGRPVGPDVFADFAASIPWSHVEFFRALPRRFERGDIIASHRPIKPGRRFRVSAHARVGETPVIGPKHAQIDTGCGESGGRLTAFAWPSRNFVQVGAGDAVFHEA